MGKLLDALRLQDGLICSGRVTLSVHGQTLADTCTPRLLLHAVERRVSVALWAAFPSTCSRPTATLISTKIAKARDACRRVRTVSDSEDTAQRTVPWSAICRASGSRANETQGLGPVLFHGDTGMYVSIPQGACSDAHFCTDSNDPLEYASRASDGASVHCCCPIPCPCAVASRAATSYESGLTRGACCTQARENLVGHVTRVRLHATPSAMNTRSTVAAPVC